MTILVTCAALVYLIGIIRLWLLTLLDVVTVNVGG